MAVPLSLVYYIMCKPTIVGKTEAGLSMNKAHHVLDPANDSFI